MKTLILPLSFFLVISTPLSLFGQDQETDVKFESDTSESDSVEYSLVIIEPGYETYLITQPPMQFYPEHYYKNWNNRYVQEWNHRYRTGPQKEIYENFIDYDYFTEYGIELEYRLYYFFQFFEDKYIFLDIL